MIPKITSTSACRVSIELLPSPAVSGRAWAGAAIVPPLCRFRAPGRPRSYLSAGAARGSQAESQICGEQPHPIRMIPLVPPAGLGYPDPRRPAEQLRWRTAGPEPFNP